MRKIYFIQTYQDSTLAIMENLKLKMLEEKLKNNLILKKLFLPPYWEQDKFRNADSPLNLTNTGESLKSVYDRVINIYGKSENTLFVTHQDVIRAFTYYYLKDKDFWENRPDHCEVQYIKNSKLYTY